MEFVNLTRAQLLQWRINTVLRKCHCTEASCESCRILTGTQDEYYGVLEQNQIYMCLGTSEYDPFAGIEFPGLGECER